MTFLGLSQTFGSVVFSGFFGFAIVVFTFNRSFSMILIVSLLPCVPSQRLIHQP